ncbi:helix-turn-helix domain-containing protein [Halarchaeum sp. P4]|uniref:helix-turn-helix domain-containing protein n=1 Tax=Halarchaeum sp. P4 TaxID=3421639 RepID=UPI003EB91E20
MAHPTAVEGHLEAAAESATRSRDASDVPREATLTEVLDALDDADCRAMLEALEDPKTASDLCEECDVPSSTAYRKLDQLSDAGLVTERVTLRDGYRQVTTYARAFDAVRVVADEDGFSVDVEARERTPADRLGEMWSQVRREP